MSVSIGIDPGKTGAIAVMDDDGILCLEQFNVDKYVDVLSYVGQSTSAKDIKVCVEKVGAMPGQGVVSMFNFGHNLGVIEGILSALRIPYQLVPPQTWKKEFSLTGDKAKSIEVCKKLFPWVDLRATEGSRKPSDGLAEALLMAEYARRKM